MPFEFGPDEEEAFLAASAELVRRYEASQDDGLGWVVDQVVDLKWRYLGGDLLAWNEDDIEVVLFELYPAKVRLEGRDHGDVINGFTRFLRFLGAEGLADATDAVELARFVESCAADFEVAMADDDRFSAGKRLVAEMVGDGVDLEDQDAVDQWIQQFNRRSFDDRVRVVGPPPERAGGRGLENLASSPLARFPPVVLAPESALEEAARASVLFERMRRLVGFVGDGRKLTDAGNLTPSDGKELVRILGTDDRLDPDFGGRTSRTRSSTQLRGVDLTFRVALAGGFLYEPTARKVRVGQSAALLDEDPLEAIGRLFGALVQDVGPTMHRWGNDSYDWGWYAADVDQELLAILVGLYREQAPLGIDDIAAEFWEVLLDEYDLDHVDSEKLEFHKSLVNSAFRRAFDRLEDLGLVVQADIEVTERAWETKDEEGGTVALTPLGVWVMNRVVSRVVEAPVAGTLSEVGADELLARVADLPEDLGRVEVDAWVNHHGDDAAALLVDALAGADETGRGLGFRALLRIGPAAADQVDRLVGDPELGPYATVWEIDAQVAPPEAMDAGGDPERFVRLLHAVLTLWNPDAVTTWVAPAAGSDGVDVALDAAWRVRLSETETVLAVIGDFYPDKSIAKSARKALFKFRSSGGALGDG